MAEQLRCHRCSYWLGEAERPVTLIGLFKGPEQALVGEPRRSHLCGHCGWVNVFREVGPAVERGVTLAVAGRIAHIVG